MYSFLILLLNTASVYAADKYKPFVLSSRGIADFDKTVLDTGEALVAGGFIILGEATPYKGTFVDNTRLIVVTNDELKKVAAANINGAFAAPWRIAITQVGTEVQVAYSNPVYIANAYRLNSDLAGVTDALAKALGTQMTFGSKEGLTAKKLRRYHYTFGMEYFPNVYELAKYASHEEAIAAVEKNLAAGVAGVSKVYRLDVSSTTTVFGVTRAAPSNKQRYMDDQFIMNIVDFAELKGTAYLPYEILVTGRNVVALHMRFRMAVQYPDLKMVGDHSFVKLMRSPDAIEQALAAIAGK